MDFKIEINKPKEEEEIVKEKFREALNPAIFLLKEVLESNHILI